MAKFDSITHLLNFPDDLSCTASALQPWELWGDCQTGSVSKLCPQPGCCLLQETCKLGSYPSCCFSFFPSGRMAEIHWQKFWVKSELKFECEKSAGDMAFFRFFRAFCKLLRVFFSFSAPLPLMCLSKICPQVLLFQNEIAHSDNHVVVQRCHWISALTPNI